MTDELTFIDADPPGWVRRAVPAAQVSIAANPKWPVLSQPFIAYQTFGRDNGAISIHWGEEATMEWWVAHVGVGSAGHDRVVDEDQLVEIAGLPARRVRLRVIAKDHWHGFSAEKSPVGRALDDRETIFVAVGFEVGGDPVRVGYRLPAVERAEFEALLERVLGGVRPL